MCVCKQISPKQQKIRIRLETRRFNKPVTIIDIIDDKYANLKRLAQKICVRKEMGQSFFLGKYFLVCKPSLTKESINGTSNSGPMTVAKAAPDPIP
jgi:hypothetical protein